MGRTFNRLFSMKYLLICISFVFIRTNLYLMNPSAKLEETESEINDLNTKIEETASNLHFSNPDIALITFCYHFMLWTIAANRAFQRADKLCQSMAKVQILDVHRLFNVQAFIQSSCRN